MAQQFTAKLSVSVEVTVNDPDAITRVTGPGGNEWRSRFYLFDTEDGVINHFAFNCIANGCTDANALDGWADLPAGAVTMKVMMKSIKPER